MVTLFEIPVSEWPAFYQREHRYQFVVVQVLAEDKSTKTSQDQKVSAVVCTAWNDRDYRRQRFKSWVEYYNRVGQIYDGPLWRQDILPHPAYLDRCLQAAQDNGQQCYNNFLDTTFLADETTSIRQYRNIKPL